MLQGQIRSNRLKHSLVCSPGPTLSLSVTFTLTIYEWQYFHYCVVSEFSPIHVSFYFEIFQEYLIEYRINIHCSSETMFSYVRAFGRKIGTRVPWRNRLYSRTHVLVQNKHLLFFHFSRRRKREKEDVTHFFRENTIFPKFLLKNFFLRQKKDSVLSKGTTRPSLMRSGSD